MKKNLKKLVVIFLLAFNFAIPTIIAQVPQAINFQAIARDGSGSPMVNTNIQIRLSVIDSAQSGIVVYQELRALQTNAYGSFSFQIGVNPAYTTVGTFQSINWGTGNKHLKIDYDPTNTFSFDLTLGVIKFVTVPYAFTAENVVYINTTGAQNGDVLTFNSITNKFEPKQIINPTIYWVDVQNKPNFAVVGTTGNYNDLIGKPVLWDSTWASIKNKPDLFDGQYSSLAGKPILWDSTWVSIKNKPLFFDGQYGSLIGIPTLATVATSGNYNDLNNKPVLFNGSYSDLTGKPVLWDSTWISIKNKPSFFDGQYSSLTGIPTLAIVATSGNYNDLNNKPVLFNGSYSDLTGKPILWDSTWASIKNKPSFFDSQFSSLTGKPTTIAGYGITDAMTITHVANGVTSTNITNWNTAYGWGNHATAGYQLLISAGTTSQYWRGDKTWQTLDKTSVGLSNVENTTLSIWTGTTNITTLGTITTGTWNAGAITSSGTIKGNSIVKTGGTSSQFLKADGSVDANTYLTAVREVSNEFTATASQITFALTQAPATNSKVKMYINGVRISNTAYIIVGSTLTYLPTNNGSYALVVGDRIQCDYYY